MTYRSLLDLADQLSGEDYNNGDTFMNYYVTGTTLEWRVGRHWAECSLDMCPGGLLRTYVPAGGNVWSDIGSL